MRKMYILLKKVRPLAEIFTKMPFVPLNDVLRNIIREEKLRKKLDYLQKKELED